MVEPEKPFACTIPDCGMTFTNEDHLHVHTRKHDMVLQLGMEQKAAFVADQTPTPTRFIRNCEEVGLFQDLQNVNPFDEGFKRAMETKHQNLLCQESAMASSSSDELHTPQMVFPLIDGDAALYSTTNNQRNITISRSSSDESGAIKEFETTTISKLTNEVTTIRNRRIVGKSDEKHDDKKNDAIRKDSVSYTNNVIKISSSNLVRKDSVDRNPIQTVIYEDTVIKDSNIVTKDGLSTDGKVSDIPPILSQKSIDFIVDSLNHDFGGNDNINKNSKRFKKEDDDYEVIIKLPNGKQFRMKAVEETNEKVSAKEVLKKALTDKVEQKNGVQRHNDVNAVPVANTPSVVTVPNVPSVVTSVPNVVSNIPSVVSNIPSVVSNIPSVVTTGTLIPVTIVSPRNGIVPKVPIMQLRTPKSLDKKAEKRKSVNTGVTKLKNDSECVTNYETASENNRDAKKPSAPKDLDSRSAASRRYRARLKASWSLQAQENQQLREANEKLKAEKAMLKMIITEHLKRCPQADDLKNNFQKVINTGTAL